MTPAARRWSWWVKVGLVAGAAGTLAVALVVPATEAPHRLVTYVSGDVAMAFIAVTLLASPVLALLGRRTPGHLAWRREVGVGAGLLALAHVVCGFRVHLGGDLAAYFSLASPRFAAANVVGGMSALALAAALMTSNGLAMRRLGGRRWKRVQHLVAPAFVLGLVHVLLYASLNQRVLAAAITAAVVAAVLVVRGVNRSRRGAPRRVRSDVQRDSGDS